jgi:hypothetical protein
MIVYDIIWEYNGILALQLCFRVWPSTCTSPQAAEISLRLGTLGCWSLMSLTSELGKPWLGKIIA